MSGKYELQWFETGDQPRWISEGHYRNAEDATSIAAPIIQSWRVLDPDGHVAASGNVDPVVLSFPFRLDATAGQNGRGLWVIKAKKAEAQKAAVRLAWNVARAKPQPLPLVIEMVRQGPSTMDDDGNVGCFKSIRDALADLLGFNDRDPLAHFIYDQRKGTSARKGTPADWRVEITISPGRCLTCGDLLTSDDARRTRWGLLHKHHNLPWEPK